MQLVHAGHRVLAPAVLTGDAAVALQRADKAGKAQLRLAGSRLRNEFLDLALHGLVVQLVRLDGRLCGSLGLLGISRRHLGRRDAAVQLALLGLHLAVLAVQLFLLALQVSLLAHQLGTVAFQRGLVGFQPGLGGFHVVHDLGVLHRDVLHDLVEGQQFIQVVHRAEHGHAAAVPQLLHGGHVLFEVAPLVLDLQLLCLDLRFLFGDLGLLGADLLFLLADAVLHRGDLPAEHADLILNDADALLQFTFQRLGGSFFLFGIVQFLFMQLDGLRQLVQLVLQAGHTAAARGRRSRVYRGRDQQADAGQAQAHRTHHAGAGAFRPGMTGFVARCAEPERFCVHCFFHGRLLSVRHSDACGWRTCCPGRPPERRPPGCRSRRWARRWPPAPGHGP